MRALDVAYIFITSYGDTVKPTNLKLNKLVYFTQVESLRQRGYAMFDDDIEAWQYGPVVPSVYKAFKRYGSDVIPSALPVQHVSESDMDVIGYVADTYGQMTAFDLVQTSHRAGGAWARVYDESVDNVITEDNIINSVDFQGVEGTKEPLGNGIRGVIDSIPNALRMLENS